MNPNDLDVLKANMTMLGIRLCNGLGSEWIYQPEGIERPFVSLTLRVHLHRVLDTQGEFEEHVVLLEYKDQRDVYKKVGTVVHMLSRAVKHIDNIKDGVMSSYKEELELERYSRNKAVNKALGYRAVSPLTTGTSNLSIGPSALGQSTSSHTLDGLFNSNALKYEQSKLSDNDVESTKNTRFCKWWNIFSK